MIKPRERWDEGKPNKSLILETDYWIFKMRESELEKLKPTIAKALANGIKLDGLFFVIITKHLQGSLSKNELESFEISKSEFIENFEAIKEVLKQKFGVK